MAHLARHLPGQWCGAISKVFKRGQHPGDIVRAVHGRSVGAQFRQRLRAAQYQRCENRHHRRFKQEFVLKLMAPSLCAAALIVTFDQAQFLKLIECAADLTFSEIQVWIARGLLVAGRQQRIGLVGFFGAVFFLFLLSVIGLKEQLDPA